MFRKYNLNSLIQKQNNDILISSREISEITNKQHQHIKRDIEVALKEDASNFGHIYFDSINRKQSEYLLPKNIALGIVSGYSFDLRMKIINRLEQLEKLNQPFQIPQNFYEALLLAANLEEQNQTLLLENKKQSQFITNVVHSHNTYTATQIAKDFDISAKLFNKILLESGVIYKNNGTYILSSRYQNYNLTEIKETEPNKDNKTFLSLRWTSKGKNWLKNNFEKALHKCDEKTFNEYNMQILSNLPQIPNTRIKRF